MQRERARDQDGPEQGTRTRIAHACNGTGVFTGFVRGVAPPNVVV